MQLVKTCGSSNHLKKEINNAILRTAARYFSANKTLLEQTPD